MFGRFLFLENKKKKGGREDTPTFKKKKKKKGFNERTFVKRRYETRRRVDR